VEHPTVENFLNLVFLYIINQDGRRSWWWLATWKRIWWG
jgi:hypothetical protein